MVMDYKFKSVYGEIEGAVLVIYLNRPQILNAWNLDLQEDLIKCVNQFDQDDSLKVAIVTGTGRAFCAGADLSLGDFSSKEHVVGRGLAEARDGGGQASLTIYRCRKPIIAAINGPAVGVGITHTLPMDIRIAYKDAKVGFVFVRRGVVPEAVSTYFLPRLVGHSKAVRLMMMGQVLPASHPLYSDLFTELTDTPEGALIRAKELAHEMASMNSSVSMAMVKALLWHGTETPEEQHLLDSKGMFSLGNSIDGKEGVASFMQKRQVKFQGTVTKDMPVFYPVNMN
ncbi:hypothetical protein SmJEL517_g04931 [Synchytrium microbalum]|uniref:Enoyl-CoA hydratase n=1 Tax=Synchytrium microbalum TaxID=1806994 RepID=A0A507BRV4_9FUNG|nr:uncharacterized protein SmJEL517_g04931 [Synchytrium microbalum]TPX31837.1 hypothetical protein SmJEL517_g04931 [Synchytrium microbalum]